MDKEFISFLKEHHVYDEEIVNSFYNNAFRYNVEEVVFGFNMCMYVMDDNDVLIDLKACIPCISNYKTMLINIHEYIHYYMMYKKLGKKVVIGRNRELLPLLYEKIYILEKDDKALNKYGERLDNIIIKENNSDYVYALEYRDKLIDLFYKCGKIKKLNKD